MTGKVMLTKNLKSYNFSCYSNEILAKLSESWICLTSANIQLCIAVLVYRKNSLSKQSCKVHLLFHLLRLSG